MEYPTNQVGYRAVTYPAGCRVNVVNHMLFVYNVLKVIIYFIKYFGV